MNNSQTSGRRYSCTVFAFWILYIVISVAVPGAIGKVTAQEEAAVLLTGEWPPYVSRLKQIDSPGLGGKGLVADLVELTLEEMGRQAQYKYLLWPEVLAELDRKQGMIAFPYRKTPNRERKYHFSAPVYSATGVLYYNILKIPEPSKIENIEQLYPYRIGMIAGYEMEAEFGDKFKQTLEVDSLHEGFEKLIAGEIDLLPVEQRVGELTVERFYSSKQHLLGSFPQFSRTRTLHLIGAREDVKALDFIKQFNQTLQRVKKSGLDKQVEARYTGSDKSANLVKLSGPSNFPLAVGSLEKDLDQGFLIPRGTRAIVVSWDPLFNQQGEFDAHKDMYQRSRVKILEGPLKDHLLWVPNLFLSFE
jgi:polar amino acid transport system substrate-binding protein